MKLNKYKGFYYQYFSEGRYTILDCELANMGERKGIEESKKLIDELAELRKQEWNSWNNQI